VFETKATNFVLRRDKQIPQKVGVPMSSGGLIPRKSGMPDGLLPKI